MATETLTLPDTARLMAATDATWAPAEMIDFGGWRLRAGGGGGKRVSAASPLQGGTDDAAIGDAEAVMRDWGQPGLFRLTPDDAALDAELDALGYRVLDPVVLYAGPVNRLAGEGSHQAALYRCEFAPAIMEEIWTAGGIGPGRLAVMDRITGPATRLLSRAGDTPCGAAFVGISDEDGAVAMIHAIEVLTRLRRQGAGRLLVEGAARFAAEHGAEWLALAVTEANAPARALYVRMGMAEAGNYHYRIAPEAPEAA